MGRKIVPDWLRTVHGHRVEPHHRYYPDDHPDHIWIPECATKDWVVLTTDLHIRKNLVNRAAVIRSGAKVVLYPSDKMSGEEIASLVVVSRLRVIDICRRQQGPFFIRVTKHGEVQRPQFFSKEEQESCLSQAGSVELTAKIVNL